MSEFIIETSVGEKGQRIKRLYKPTDYYRALPEIKTADKATLYTMRTTPEQFCKGCYVMSFGGERATDLFVGYRTTSLTIYGKKMFYRTNWVYKAGFRNGKLYGDWDSIFCRSEITKELLEALGLECLVDYNLFLRNKTVLKAVLTGKATSPEDVVRRFFKSAYHLSNIDWRCYSRVYLDGSLMGANVSFISLINCMSKGDLDWLMKHINDTLDENKRLSELSEYLELLRDVLSDCLILDKTLNPRWSMRRLNAEHQKNAKKILEIAAEAEKPSEKSIYEGEPLVLEDGELEGEILNSPLEVFKESKTMHHCIYYNYLQQILTKQYIGIRVSGDERCTLGLRVSKDAENNYNIVFDQIRGDHNASVSNYTRESVMGLVERFKEKILNFIRPETVTTFLPQELYPEIEDFPF